MSWPCFWVEDTGYADIHLRRFTFTDKAPVACTASYGHTAQSPALARVEQQRSHEGYLTVVDPYDYAENPAWPTACEVCGYAFRPEDEWQVNQEAIYKRPDTGEEWPQKALPVGAMFDAFWMPTKGPDGIALAVVLPPPAPDSRGHVWFPDHPSSSGGAWTRTGDPKAVPPTVDCNPSILTGDYHGYLRLGVLTDPV